MCTPIIYVLHPSPWIMQQPNDHIILSEDPQANHGCYGFVFPIHVNAVVCQVKFMHPGSNRRRGRGTFLLFLLSCVQINHIETIIDKSYWSTLNCITVGIKQEIFDMQWVPANTGNLLNVYNTRHMILPLHLPISKDFSTSNITVCGQGCQPKQATSYFRNYLIVRMLTNIYSRLKIVVCPSKTILWTILFLNILAYRMNYYSTCHSGDT